MDSERKRFRTFYTNKIHPARAISNAKAETGLIFPPICAILSGQILIGNTNMLLTIVTVTKNAAGTVAHAAESLGHPLPDGVEYILKDAESSDGTSEVVRGIQPGAVVVQSPDRGIYDAMNQGWTRARGEYVMFLNADDRYLPGALEEMMRELRANPDADILHGCIRVNGRKYRPAQGLASFHGARIFHPASAIRRSLLDRLGGFDYQWKICADLDFFLRAKESGATFLFVDREITDFALGGVSTVRRKDTASEVRHILLARGFGHIFADGYYLAARLRACASHAVKIIKGS